ncbi:MAG: hypothetical protein LBT88_07365 [Oscillospiraceae bacterium]|jgi:hypothetical protein|nr:hypothetical protein [Oscillospiraceae bacterium]
MNRQNYSVIIKSLLATLLAVAVGAGVHYAHRVTYLQDPASRNIELMQTYMQDAQSLFVEKSIPVQDIAMLVWDKPGYRAVQMNFSESPLAKTINGSEIPQTVLDAAFTLSASGASVKNVTVTKEGAYFYTSYTDAGVVGFVYETYPDSVTDYDTMELLENWKIFYRLNE